MLRLMSSGVSVVVTTVPGREMLLARALRSVEHQLLAPEEVIVSLDTERLGAAVNRDRGLAQVTTEWVAFLDDDDVLFRPHIETCLAAGLQTGADLVTPWFMVLGGGTDPFPQHRGEWDDANPRQIPVTFLARTEMLRAAGGFGLGWDALDPEAPGVDPEGHRAGEDWRLTLRLVQMGAKITALHEVTWGWYHWTHADGRVGNSMGLPSRV